jgi:nitrous-oxide reductase
MPCGKSPHGVDVSPDGRYIIGIWQAAGRHRPAFNFEKIQTAIRNKDFTGEGGLGIPVLKYESIKDAEDRGRSRPSAHPVRPDGLGLHFAVRRQRDLRSGSSARGKSSDKAPMSYSIGHLSAAGGRHRQPGRQVSSSASNKLCTGRHLNVGPVAAGIVAAASTSPEKR